MTESKTTTSAKPTQERRDEHELVARAREGDVEARRALLVRHRPGVLAVARHYVRPQLNLEDLFQEGCLGVLSALEGFDAAHGVAFWTYAHYWVVYRIQRFAFENRRIVRPPRTRVERRIRRSIRHVRGSLIERLGREPDREELADALGVEEIDLARHEANATSTDVRLDQRRVPDLPSDDGDPEELSARREEERRRSRALTRAMKRLDPREAAIVERRFLDPEGESYASLGRDFGVSRERVRQLSVRALGKIRSCLAEDEEHFAATAGEPW